MFRAIENAVAGGLKQLRFLRPPAIVEWSTLRSLAVVTGSALFIGMAALLVVIAITFALGGRIAGWHFFIFPLTVLATIYIACRRLDGRRSLRRTGGTMAAVLVLITAAFGGEALTVDLSADGQSTHQAAISIVAHGWNPYRDPGFDHPDKLSPDDYLLRELPQRPLFSKGYIVKNAAKGTYYQAGAAEALFGTTSAGKGFNVITLAAAFLLVVAAASHLGAAPVWSLAAGFTAAFNPVAVNQLLSTYVDGQLAMILTGLVALGVIMAFSKKRLPVIAFGAVVVLGINVKLTGFFYTGFLGLMTVICLRWATGAYKAAGVFILASAIGTFLVGYSPFVLDIVQDGSLFAYLKTTPIWENSFVTDHDRLTKLFMSLFSQTEINPIAPHLKAPFGVNWTELSDYRSIAAPDARIGGFGPWMGGAVFLSAIVMLFYFVRQTKGRWFLVFATGALFISALANPEAWWARFSPQVWLIPVAIAVFGLRYPLHDDAGAIARALIAVIVINAGFVFAQSCYAQINQQIAANKVLDIMAETSRPFDVYVENFYFNELLMKRRGIAIRETDLEHCKAFFRPVYLRMNACFDGAPGPEMMAAIEKVRAVETELNEKGLNDWLLLNL